MESRLEAKSSLEFCVLTVAEDTFQARIDGWLK